MKRAQDGAGAAFTPSAGFNALHLSWAVVLEYIIRGTVVPKSCMLLQMNLQLLVDPVQETGVFHGVFALVHGESDGEASAPLTFILPCTDPHGAALGAPRGGAPGSALLTAAHEESRELELVLVRRERVVQLDLAPSPPGQEVKLLWGRHVQPEGGPVRLFFIMNENAFLPQQLDVDYHRDRVSRVELVHVLSEECPGGVNVFRRNVHLSREPPGLVPGLLQSL